MTPNGTYAFIAGNTTGDVAVVRLSNNEVVGRIRTGGNPYAIAISNDGDRTTTTSACTSRNSSAK